MKSTETQRRNDREDTRINAMVVNYGSTIKAAKWIKRSAVMTVSAPGAMTYAIMVKDLDFADDVVLMARVSDSNRLRHKQ